MKRKIIIKKGNREVEKEVSYIPVRYVFAILITALEVVTMIGIVFALCYFVPYFFILVITTTVAVELEIIASDTNPDYKIPWMIFVLILPIAGFMLYFIFSSRTLKKKFIKRLNKIKLEFNDKNDEQELSSLREKDKTAYSYAKLLKNTSETHVYCHSDQQYFSCGEDYFASLTEDLKKAEKFIFMEYFIIEEGKFWNTCLEILKDKASKGVDIRVIYDDIGCMMTLPGNYCKILEGYGIHATVFSKLRVQADNEFNNRSHRKITVIDGKIGYTGGINLADEYINAIDKFGYWKDSGVRLMGKCVWELTGLFLIDYGMNMKKDIDFGYNLYPESEYNVKGYVIPFGDGHKPLYRRRVAETVIKNMFDTAQNYVYITTPYLIIDDSLCTCIENAAIRGVDVRIIVPHIPDKKIILNMTRSYYARLVEAGVKLYEFEPGFIHAKTYLADDKYAMLGTVNLDYRSLVHHFENGVFFYDCACIKDIKKDIDTTLSESIEIKKKDLKTSFVNRVLRAVIRIFSPML